jgi:uridine phosphorylase
MSILKSSELILTPSGTVYHLGLNPDQIGKTIFTVGDPDRVPMVSKYFDSIEIKVQTREFVTHTGWLGGKKVTVISTGIGTDNIDIVLNELDALVNIDFYSRMVKKELTQLDIIRIGTTGSISKNIGINDFLVNSYAIGLDGLLHFYSSSGLSMDEAELEDEIYQFSKFAGIEFPVKPYIPSADKDLLKVFDKGFKKGIGFTAPGFYGPQSRYLRTHAILPPDFFEKWNSFDHKGHFISNLEMETAGIYGLSKILGHRAISCNVILADRIKGTFAIDPEKSIDNLIKSVLRTWVDQ